MKQSTSQDPVRTRYVPHCLKTTTKIHSSLRERFHVSLQNSSEQSTQEAPPKHRFLKMTPRIKSRSFPTTSHIHNLGQLQGSCPNWNALFCIQLYTFWLRLSIILGRREKLGGATAFPSQRFESKSNILPVLQKHYFVQTGSVSCLLCSESWKLSKKTLASSEGRDYQNDLQPSHTSYFSHPVPLKHTDLDRDRKSAKIRSPCFTRPYQVKNQNWRPDSALNSEAFC